MSLTRVNLSLAVALVVCLVIIRTCGRDFSRPNIEFMPDMAYSAAYESFSSNPNFADGKTLQPLPAGTVAVDEYPLHYDATPEDAARAGRELRNPWPADSAAVLDRGAFVYSAFCRQCHGAAGLGDGPVARRGYPPPPSLLTDRARTLPDGQLFHILTWGQGNMPAHAAQISRGDRWAAIHHVRALQRRAPSTPLTDPSGASPDPDAASPGDVEGGEP